jgi:hypothetical protein
MRVLPRSALANRFVFLPKPIQSKKEPDFSLPLSSITWES